MGYYKNVSVTKDLYKKDMYIPDDKIVVFGDNYVRSGTGGQAVIRDIVGSYGIMTKKYPSMQRSAFFDDRCIPYIKQDIIDLYKIALKTKAEIVFPVGGLGTGLSKLDTYSPKASKMMEGLLHRLFGITFHNGVIGGERLSTFDYGKSKDRHMYYNTCIDYNLYEKGETDDDGVSVFLDSTTRDIHEEWRYTDKNSLGLCTRWGYTSNFKDDKSFRRFKRDVDIIHRVGEMSGKCVIFPAGGTGFNVSKHMEYLNSLFHLDGYYTDDLTKIYNGKVNSFRYDYNDSHII